MDDDLIEEMFSGFCKTFNETRTVICEFVKRDGQIRLESAGCAYGKCPHSKMCLLMKQAREMETL
ncbi:ubiquinone biosynthesis protein UbiE [Lacrimispora sp. NSJ-141]|uniref:Ubiquinone biosynthesis protein UbiE n=1 Tax=Lientehia hominis TaxID=2897778 RepID=A0AAP2RKF1_9FIRM|nr:ubiquinone biosynthesis protein UbiE [Lientehia hominis]MCD2493038.1 ubiquinone biosynthesis protein UbiE [Lientehia hominis]